MEPSDTTDGTGTADAPPPAAIERSPELLDALARAREPIPRRRLPPAPLRVRLKTSPLLHRLVPLRLAVRRAQARGEATWEQDAEERTRATRAMLTLVGEARAGEVAALARAHLIEQQVERALFWQPWRLARMDAQSHAHACAALTSGRPVLLSSIHQGPIFLHIAAVTALGRRAFICTGDWFFEQPTPDYWGRRIARWQNGLRKTDKGLIRLDRAFEVMRALLEDGEMVAVYFDLPGSRPTEFLGRQVMLASGTARLAAMTKALVLPVRSRREGAIVWSDVSAPLDAEDFADHEQLHDAVAAIHARWILERPAAVEDPNRDGGWAQHAGAQP